MFTQQDYEEFSWEFFRRVRRAILLASYSEKRKVSVREVTGRPEDTEIDADHIGEEVGENLLEGKSVHVFSEHREYGVDEALADEFWVQDPLDNSRLFQESLPHMWYTVFSAYDAKTLEPRFTMVGDIRNNSIRITRGDENYELSLGRKRKVREKKLTPSGKVSIDEQFRLASYTMSNRYLIPLLESPFGTLIRELHPRALIYPNGGSNIYGDLAAGRLDAYLMLNEPREEIDPGYPIARNARCPIVIIWSNGRFEEYRFNPQRLKRKESVPLLLAAATPELRDCLLEYGSSHR